MKYILVLLLWLFGWAAFAQLPNSVSPQSPTPPAEPPVKSEPDIELNTVLMKSTFLIEGPAGPSTTTLGTVFVIGLPIPNTTPPVGKLVMVTAAHVLEEIQGDFAILHLRREVDANTNSWMQVPIRLQIRANGNPLWKKNPQADVAVMYIEVPNETPITPITPLMFADDEKLVEYGVNPGDELRCLGYPLGLGSNDAGFPILRSGFIASYPLTPTEQTKTFLFDFRVFKGNSGGPVYFVEKNRPLMTGLGRYQNYHFIMGLIADEKLATQTSIGPYSQEIHQTQLGLAVVVHASVILQTIHMLPPPQ